MDKDRKNKIREAYENAAMEYSKKYFFELYDKPIDKKLYDLFFERVINKGQTIEIGCGPGEISNYLKMKGLDIIGIDISEKMIGIANELNPEISFEVGDIFNLRYPDNSFAGVVAPYLIVNFSLDDLSYAFSEIHRILIDNGLFLFSFHIGDGNITVDDFLTEGNKLDFVFFDPDKIIEVLVDKEFEIIEKIIRSPYEGEFTERAYVFAKKK